MVLEDGIGRRWFAGAQAVGAAEVENTASLACVSVEDRPASRRSVRTCNRGTSSSRVTEVVDGAADADESSCPTAVVDSPDAVTTGRVWSTNRAMRPRSASLPFVVEVVG